jgi:tetratricopeptide (TPR) repeat protein
MVAVAIGVGLFTPGASEAQLGTVAFPTSATGETQERFVRGVGFLHSFAFDDAIENFQKAQQLDPDFVLAYWGEAMAYNDNPLVEPTRQNIAAARRALAKLGSTRVARASKARSARERGYLEAVEFLYGEGDKDARDRAYAAAMARVVDENPDDDEARAFYALALLGTVRRASTDYRAQMKAAAIAQDLFRRHPDHPGAAHYIIHAFDDPIHAPLALYAAQRYAEIAPEAEHALHMPAHTFVQLGMWTEVARSNRAAYDASVAWVERKGQSETKRDFHALSWLQYAHLQLGHFDEAKRLIGLLEPVAKREITTSQIEATLEVMRARYAIETARFNEMPLTRRALGNERYSGDAIAVLALGMAAAHTGDLETAAAAERRLGQLKNQSAEGLKSWVQGQVTLEDLQRSVAVSEKQVGALVRLKKGQPDEALRAAREAIAIEDTMHPSYGPPEPIKPPHEFYGELLLGLGRARDALAEFEAMLVRNPNRVQSLLGAARAATATDERERASRYYAQLLRIWDESSQAAARQEAKDFRGQK